MKGSLREEEELFINHSNGHTTNPNSENWRQHHRPSKINSSNIFITFATIITLSLAVNAWLLLHVRTLSQNLSGSSTQSSQFPYSPADPYITHQIKSINTHDDHDPFIGPPDATFDHAWSQLLHPASIRVTPTELRKAGKQSLRFRDDDDDNDESYLAYLEVYHQLHCVKRMVQFRWPDHYPDLQSQHMLTDAHFNHCIQVLRKGIMCNADTAMNTYTWDPRNSTHLLSISDAPRKCVDWERVHAWAGTRAVGHDYVVRGVGEEGYLGPSVQ